MKTRARKTKSSQKTKSSFGKLKQNVFAKVPLQKKLKTKQSGSLVQPQKKLKTKQGGSLRNKVVARVPRNTRIRVKRT